MHTYYACAFTLILHLMRLFTAEDVHRRTSVELATKTGAWQRVTGHTHTHTHKRARAHTHTHTHTHTHVHTYTHTHAHTHAYTRRCAHALATIKKYSSTCTHPSVLTHVVQYSWPPNKKIHEKGGLIHTNTQDRTYIHV